VHLSLAIRCNLCVVFCVLVILTVDGTVLTRRFRLFLWYSGNSPPFIETIDLLSICYCLLECDDVVTLVPTYQTTRRHVPVTVIFTVTATAISNLAFIIEFTIVRHTILPLAS
jgi:hypothetical protein